MSMEANFEPSNRSDEQRAERKQFLRKRVREMNRIYAKPNFWKSSWQLINILGLYTALMYGAYQSWHSQQYLLMAVFVLINSFCLNRIFVIFHDVMHGSFFKRKTTANVWGTLLSLLVYQPAHHWQYEHANHHATASDLSKRGIGDMPMLTVKEYSERNLLGRLAYRMLRWPPFYFGVHGVYKQLIKPRWVAKKGWPKRVSYSVWFTNVALVVIGLGFWAAGFSDLFLIHALCFAIGTPNLLILFYVSHHFETTVWRQPDDWDFIDAALNGTSILLYPPIFDWFTAGIGYHVQHHLLPRVPNYNLRKCWKENPDVYSKAFVIEYFDILKTTRLRLWDEASELYVGREGYRMARTLRQQSPLPS